MNRNLHFSIGDRLVRQKGGVFTKHHAVYAGNGLVAENQVKVGVRYITQEQFLSEGKLVRVERFEGNYWQRQTILQRITARIGRAYDLEGYNCEHFANDVLLGEPKSEQMDNAKTLSGISLALGLGCLLFGHTKTATALIIAGGAGLGYIKTHNG